MSGQEEIVRDIVFVGATRPAMLFGVTLEAFLLNGLLTSIIFLATGNPLYLFGGLPVHLLCYLICLNEPRRFKLLFLKGKCIAENKNRMFWKCNSYSPF